MNVAAYILESLKTRKLTQTWLAKQVGIKRVTFALKVKKNRFTANELILICKALELDMNELKELPISQLSPVDGGGFAQ
jgi:hypothetical protein